jgi:glycosyltransferase involved in cell wall biosynthesis
VHFGLVIYGDLETLTGGYVYDRRLAEHLQRAGDRVSIISLPWRSYARHLGDNLSSNTARRLVDLGADLVLEDELNHPSLLAANNTLTRATGVPIVAIVHHLRSSEAWPPGLRLAYQLIERAYLRGVDGFVYNSQATRFAVERLAGTAKPSVLAPPGGDRLGTGPEADAVRARAVQPGPLRILFVGSLIARKGLHVLLDALTGLPAGDWSLEVIGDTQRDPEYAARIRRQVSHPLLRTSVRLLGTMGDDQLAEALRRSHVLAVPSTHEGFGIVYLEAMIFGLPVLASAAGGASDVVVDGETGYLIAPGDVRALAGHLAALSRDRGLLARLALAARRRAIGWPRWVESMEAIRQFLLRSASPGATAPAMSMALGGVQ